MSAIQFDTRTDRDEILYQSVVDDEFRAQLLADPSLLGSGESVTLPAAIEPQNTSGLDLAAGEHYNIRFATSCSFGIFTVVCDGCSK